MSAVSGAGAKPYGALVDQLGTWDVLPGLRELYQLYARSVNESALNGCNDALGAAGGDVRLDRELARLAPLIDRSNWTTPDLAFAHHLGLSSRRSDLLYVSAVVASLSELERPHAPALGSLVASRDRPWLPMALRLLSPSGRQSSEQCVEVVPPSADGAANLQTALGHLERAWPAMASAVLDLVREIVWMRLPYPAGTLPQLFGAVFVRRGPSVVELVESLVHETTHLDLIMRSSVDKLIVNRSADAKSPFLAEPRPIMRVLHAAVVSARVWVAHDLCVDRFEGDQRAASITRRNRSAAELASALASLNLSAKCTPIGRRLLDTLNCLSEEIGNTTARLRPHCSDIALSPA